MKTRASFTFPSFNQSYRTPIVIYYDSNGVRFYHAKDGNWSANIGQAQHHHLGQFSALRRELQFADVALNYASL